MDGAHIEKICMALLRDLFCVHVNNEERCKGGGLQFARCGCTRTSSGSKRATKVVTQRHLPAGAIRQGAKAVRATLGMEAIRGTNYQQTET